MKHVKSLVVLVLVGGFFGTGLPAYGEKPRMQIADATARQAADCFAACESGECLRDCIKRLLPRDGASREAVERRSRVTECFADCESPACLRACVTDHSAVIDSKTGEESTQSNVSTVEAEASLVDCTVAALDDVVTCADVFLAPGDEDIDGFWVCVGGAGRKFLNCTGLKATATEAPQAEVQFALRLIVEMGVDVVSVNNLADWTHRSRGIRNESAVKVPMVQQQADNQVTFNDCASGLKKDRGTCKDVFAGDNEGLQVCLDGAKLSFTNCINSLQ